MKITIAIQGCCHGELDNIYGTLQLLEEREGRKIDLLLICGDFEAVRNADDLETMACPPKFRDLKDFFKYYSGVARAPIPTIFIGGNHEASAYLMELYYGGWAAPNIYFLGFAGCIRFGGLRIAGLSGIYKSHDYLRGRHERLPYDNSTMRSVYHVRDFEAFRLKQLLEPIDIFLSHDWPVHVTRYGDAANLFRRKPYFKQEAENGELGSVPAQELMEALHPNYWFSAHLHVKFSALVRHLNGETTRFLSLDKCLPGRDFIQVLDVDVPDEQYAGDVYGKPMFEYDEEWLAVLRSTWQATNLKFQHHPLPFLKPQPLSQKDPSRGRFGPPAEDLDFVRQVFQKRGSRQIPDNFHPTAPAHNENPDTTCPRTTGLGDSTAPRSAPRPGSLEIDPMFSQKALGSYQPFVGGRGGARGGRARGYDGGRCAWGGRGGQPSKPKGRMPVKDIRNPQTLAFAELLGVPYNLDHDVDVEMAGLNSGYRNSRSGSRWGPGGQMCSGTEARREEEATRRHEGEAVASMEKNGSGGETSVELIKNNEEIDLDLDDDDDGDDDDDKDKDNE